MSTSSDKPTPSGGSHYQPSMPVVALILVLFIGTAFLVERSSTPAVAGKHPSTTTTTHHSAGGSTSTTTVVTHHASKSQVSVQVTNGTSVSGLARTYTVKLQTLGWDTLSPINGPHVTATVIYFKAGYQWAASEIATALHVPQSAAQSLGAQQPVAGAQGDDIVIVLGPNVAH